MLVCRTLAVDKTMSRTEDMHIATYDLSCDDQVDSLLMLMEKEIDNLIYIHFAPACGTASRARHLEQHGYMVAKPLRSEDQPEGVDALFGVDKIRTEAANIVYYNTAKIIRWAHERNIACSLENPGNSLFWMIPCISAMMQDIGGYQTSFHNCCHGGLRKKLSLWWSNVDWFLPLTATCDDDHYHKPWNPRKNNGQSHYPTSEEAAYPILLCERSRESSWRRRRYKEQLWHQTCLNSNNTLTNGRIDSCLICYPGAKSTSLWFQNFNTMSAMYIDHNMYIFSRSFSRIYPKGPRWSIDGWPNGVMCGSMKKTQPIAGSY